MKMQNHLRWCFASEVSPDRIACSPTGLAKCLLCAEHVRQLEGESPFDNLMEVKS